MAEPKVITDIRTLQEQVSGLVNGPKGIVKSVQLIKSGISINADIPPGSNEKKTYTISAVDPAKCMVLIDSSNSLLTFSSTGVLNAVNGISLTALTNTTVSVEILRQYGILGAYILFSIQIIEFY